MHNLQLTGNFNLRPTVFCLAPSDVEKLAWSARKQKKLRPQDVAAELMFFLLS